MRYLTVILLVLLFAPGGCDGDSDPPANGDGNGGNGNGGNGGGYAMVLASGSVVAAGGTPAALFMITEPGTLKATVSWSAPPATLDVGFVHEGILIDVDTGGSTVTKTQTVTATHVAGGTNWELYIGNSGPNVTVDYTVTFMPD